MLFKKNKLTEFKNSLSDLIDFIYPFPKENIFKRRCKRILSSLSKKFKI
jgi:hypothetical protein